jgi:hypothetical protein
MRRIVWGTFIAALSACASNPGVAPMGGDRYSVSRQGATGASSQSQIHADTLREADAFCSAKGQQMEVITTRQAKPPYIFGNFPRSEVDFRCM